MNNDHQDHHNPRLPFPHAFNIGTTLQNVFRNLNQAFATTHDSTSGETTVDSSQDRSHDVPPLQPIDHPVLAGPDFTSHIDAVSASTPVVSAESISSASTSTMPPHLQHEDDEDSMPELRSVTDSSDESDVDVANTSAIPPSLESQLVEDDNDSEWTDDNPPPVEPITGSRRARVTDDLDDARDRRHPSERIGNRPLPGDAAPQPSNPQQPDRPQNDHRAGGFFAPLFAMNHFGGGNAPRREDNPNEHTPTHTGEGTADPFVANNNPSSGRAPRVVPAIGFTFTIPLYGPANGNQTGAAGGQQPGLFGVDAAAREELLASFAAFFQELQALDEAREDPERAKKLVAGLEVVPSGLVKRLERVGGAPGGHVGDLNAEGSSSGCAICWDTLLDNESGGFGTQHPSGDETSQSLLSQNGMSSDSNSMDVDSSSAPSSHPEPSGETPTSSSSEESKIITLPCAHVFHASCLLPWFTRAKQATCPTCRFNIDPENLTYTPPSRRPARPPPAQPDNAPNPAPAQPQAPADVPLAAPPMNANAADAGNPPNPQPAATDAQPEAAARPHNPIPPPFIGRGGPALGFAIPLMSFPAIQIPLRPNGGAGGDQGVDIVTIGLDMFIGGPPPGPPGDRGGNARGDDASANNDAEANGEAGRDGAEDANLPPPADIHSVLEGLLRATRNLFTPHGPTGPAPAPPADGPQPPQPAAGRAPEAAGAPPAPPPDGPRIVPLPPLRPNMFRPTRPMPPRRERKTWTLPPAPGPSLRQRVEQREREQGLRCSDISCGVGPSDEDPCPEQSPGLTKQVCIHSHSGPDHESDVNALVCGHMFHPACLVSAERVAGWGGEDRTETIVEVSCPVCRAVGCVMRDEWEAGVSAL